MGQSPDAPPGYVTGAGAQEVGKIENHWFMREITKFGSTQKRSEKFCRGRGGQNCESHEKSAIFQSLSGI